MKSLSLLTTVALALAGTSFAVSGGNEAAVTAKCEKGGEHLRLTASKIAVTE